MTAGRRGRGWGDSCPGWFSQLRDQGTLSEPFSNPAASPGPSPSRPCWAGQCLAPGPVRLGWNGRRARLPRSALCPCSEGPAGRHADGAERARAVTAPSAPAPTSLLSWDLGLTLGRGWDLPLQRPSHSGAVARPGLGQGGLRAGSQGLRAAPPFPERGRKCSIGS